MPGFRALGAAAIGENRLAADPLTTERGHGQQQKAHRCCLILIRKHLYIIQSRGVVDGHTSLLVPGITGATEPVITGDSITNPLKAGQLFGGDVDYVAGPCSLIAAHRLGGLQVLEPPKPYDLEHLTKGGDRSCQHPGNATESAALMAEFYSALHL